MRSSILVTASLWVLSASVSVVRAQDVEGTQPPSAEFDDNFGNVTEIASARTTDDELGRVDEATGAEPEPESRLTDHNSLSGPVGGVHVIDAGSGPRGTFRLSTHGQLFQKDGYLARGDQHRRVAGGLSLSVSVTNFLELSAQITTSSTESTDLATQTREVYQVVGDGRFVAKGFYAVLPYLTLGGDIELALLNGIGGIGIDGSGTSVALRQNATLDLRERSRPLPLILRQGVRYAFDNSAKLATDVEDARYASLRNPARRLDEVRHLLTPVERAAFQINRVDMLTFSLGIEVPLDVGGDVFLHPIGEFRLGIPSNRQGYDCVVRSDPSDPDGCLANEGLPAFPSTFTVGLRVLPVLRGLSVLLAADIATSGDERLVRELAPSPRYELLFGLSYAYDTRTPKPRVVTRVVRAPVAVAEPVKPLGRILGEIVDAETGAGVPRVIVRFVDRELSDIVSDESGRFASYGLSPGDQALLLTAQGYTDAECQALLPEDGSDLALRCSMQALPKLAALKGLIRASKGAQVASARVRLTGPRTLELQTDETGRFEASELPFGSYQAQVEAEGYLVKQVLLDIDRPGVRELDVELSPAPKNPMVQLRARVIAIRRQVQFVSNSAEIRPSSSGLLSEVVDILLRNPQITKVEIQGHTDDAGGEARNMQLSQERADAVRTWLVSAGVEASRLEAVGYGPRRPVAPNITPANRAKNRRVEFHIREQRE
jgi:outer membrane protein OmpA-like peptidoglycan-associated protein